MRVLLVNGNRFKQPWPVIPFGLCCVAASVEAAGHQVEVLDLCFAKDPEQAVRSAIGRFAPEAVGISIRNIDNSAGYNTLFLLEETRSRIVAPIKRAFGGPIVIGGPSVGISGAEMLEFFDLPYAIRGDGEAAMAEWLKRLEQGMPLVGVGGLVIREGGKIVQDNEPLRVQNLAALPAVKPQRYIDLAKYRRFDSPLQVQTKRGCALNCTYCTYNEIEGSSYRLFDPQRVADQIEELVRETGITHLEFTDSTFNIPLGHAKEVLRALIAKKLDLRLRTMGLNPGAVDVELADLLYQAGFRDIDLGVESGCDVTLKGLGKNFSTKDVLKAGRLLGERKIPVTWYLLVGAPGETRETLRETFQTVNAAASPWDLINIGIGVRVYNGAPLAKQMSRENPGCSPDNFLHPVHFEPSRISLEEVKILTKDVALGHPNYFMYDEDETTPPLVMMMGVALMRLFAPRQPIWKLHIVLRSIQRYLGVSFLKRSLYRMKHKEVLS